MKRTLLTLLAAPVLAFGLATVSDGAFARDHGKDHGRGHGDHGWNEGRHDDRGGRNYSYDRDGHRDRGREDFYAHRERHEDRHDRYEDRYDRRERYDDRRDYDRRRTVYYQPAPRVVYRPASYRHGYARGHRYHDYYRGPVYVVRDYPRYHVRHPPRGYHWIRDDRGNLLLVAIATGIIADYLLN